MQTTAAHEAVPAADNAARKKAARRWMALATGGLLLLTLFSNTILTFSLPTVSAERPKPGMLEHVITGSARIEAAETADVFSEVSWFVNEVFVKAGDKVEAGQPLVSFKTDTAADSIRDLQDQHRQKELNLKKTQDAYIDARMKGDDKEVKDAARQIESAKLELQMLERKIAQLRRQLDTQSVLKAPASGIVAEVNAQAGGIIPAGKAAVRIKDRSKGFSMTVPVAESKAKYASVGEAAEVIVPSWQNARLKGTITEIRYPESAGPAALEKKEIVVTMYDDRLIGGETGELSITKKEPGGAFLVPSEAIRQSDGGGYYVLVLKERKGPLGTEYYAEKAEIQTGSSDDTNTAVQSGLRPTDRVIVSASKPIDEGSRVIAETAE
ncbi:efflux RND transporter periplasmic adaptor subunit [Paenibacillus hamazuiensis]|uniref:efflux RND transporter periplasmic adaptor subunit n=1 Tax=Paenibacillus hamazuiensis TaxID=2936508 RepID=UPI00200BC12A|nr:efflux RND transporter periplasmic adaptor subunit [Paenibacillus hamazuiensis]